MTEPIRPKPIELVLAEQANDAMQQGAEPHAATEMLGTMLRHLKANPTLAQQGNDALAQGADPHAIAGKVWELAKGAPDGKSGIHAEYASGRLAARMDQANKHDADALAAERPGLLTRTLGTLAATGQEIPGVEAAQAGARALIRRQPYREALSDIRGAEDAAPAVARFGAKTLGGTLALMAIPSSAMRAGATYGIANGALEANPDAGVGDRFLTAGAEGAMGALAGKAGELLSPVLRSVRAPRVDANITARTAERTAQSAPKYADFRALGDLGETPALKDILDLPIIRRAIETVKGESPKLSKLPDTHAEVLDAVYKRVGSKAWNATHGFESGEARNALVDAIEEAAQTKGGSYKTALDAYAQPSAGIQAVKRGSLALKNAGSSYGTPLAKAAEESPAAFEQWAQRASPTQRQAATEGVLGRLSDSPKLARLSLGPAALPIPFPSRAVLEAPGLLSALGQQDPFSASLARAFATQQAAAGPLTQAITRRRY